LSRNLVAAALLALAPSGALAADAFPPSAPIALMVDLSSGRVLYSREADRRFLPASLTKIMTAYVAFDLIDGGRLDEGKVVRVPAAIAAEWNGKGTSMYLKAGEDVRVGDLLRGIVTASANDACVVLAQAVAGDVPGFTRLMNAKARELGLKGSHFGTPNGWPDGGRTYVSASDLVVLSAALIERHPVLYRRYFGQAAMDWNGVSLRNHNPLYCATAGADGVKTGHTNEAGYNFVGTAERDGRRVLMVIGGSPSEALRRDESRAFIEWAFAAWEGRRLFGKGDIVGKARVQGGASRSVPLAAPRALFVSMPKGTKQHYDLAIRYAGPIAAPLREGQQVGQLVVRMDGAPPVLLPLVAGANVAAANAPQRLWNGLMDLAGL